MNSPWLTECGGSTQEKTGIDKGKYVLSGCDVLLPTVLSDWRQALKAFYSPYCA